MTNTVDTAPQPAKQISISNEAIITLTQQIPSDTQDALRTSRPSKIAVSREMREAGGLVVERLAGGGYDPEFVAEQVFRAMRSLAAATDPEK